jgi:hypothetical protein
MQFQRVLISSIALLLFCVLTGCYGPTPHKIACKDNTFAIRAESPDQRVITVVVYDSADSPLGKLVWQITAIEPVFVKDFAVTVGQVPSGFKQDVPEKEKSFVPTNGKLYSIGIVRERDDSCVALPWVAGTSVAQENLVYEQQGDIYIHKTSGFKFPAKVGNFKREKKIIRYDATGNDFSVPYNLLRPGLGIVGTVYVYPISTVSEDTSSVDGAMEKAYEKAKQEVLKVHSGRIVSEVSCNVTKSSKTYTGKRAVFQLPEQYREGSYLYVFAYNDWLVKYRFTFPAQCIIEANDEVEKFVQEFEWQ